MSDIAIKAEGLSKLYRLGTRERYRTLRDSITDTLSAPFRRRKPRASSHDNPDTFWALKDVSFEVKHGEVIGIVGRNGAGKSTLLKILSRITEPTQGEARIHGRIASLLEVGTGFHPELTGRDNIYLNGAILGMKKAEIRRKFDEIVDFAEVEKFIDTPVKHYSSGMYVRLAFAVAAHLTVELLFVDEVLAVGDATFQKKCLGKMSQTTREGRTVLFVSHNMAAMRNLCSRAIWLQNGNQILDGEASKVIGRYLSATSSTAVRRKWRADEVGDSTRGYLSGASLQVQDDEHIDTNTRLEFCFEYVNRDPGAILNFSLVLSSLEGVCIFNSISPARPTPEGVLQGRCVIPGGLLNDGQYRVRILVVKDTSVALCDEDEALVFEVHDAPRDLNWYGKWSGVIRPTLPWAMSMEESREAADAVSSARH
jgi:lipopolysaccharide transport system ATP-binding protein